MRNFDKILGLPGVIICYPQPPPFSHIFIAPEPLARLVRDCMAIFIPLTYIQYSPSYYRATWIVTGLDAGFATAMSVRPKWLRDVCSIIFALYYIVFAHEADEKVRV